MNMQALHGVFLSGRDFAAFARGLAFHGGSAWSAAATILGEEAEQGIHRVEPGGVDHRPTIAAYGDKPGGPQPIEVKSQGIRRKVERGRDGARRLALRSGLHQQAEYIEPIILGERSQGRDDICLFHISTNIETMGSRQATFR
jgi:hypothetical protein